MSRTDYDAVVVGAGPNGLAAAIHLQRKGLSVLLLEAKDTAGGGLRSAELTLPGFVHDVCSAIHPLAVSSPFFRTLPLNEHGLEFIYSEYCAAHPFDDGTAAMLSPSIKETAKSLGIDRKVYTRLMKKLSTDWPAIAEDVLGPLKIPKHPAKMLSFGLKAITSASYFARRFKGPKAAGLWAGMAAHSMVPLFTPASSAIGLVLLAAAHTAGWPVARGGSQSIANALVSCFLSYGGKLGTGTEIKSIDQLPSARAILFDLGPRQLLRIAGDRFAPFYSLQLRRFRYGMGVFKIDWALDGPVPFTNEACRRATTVHLGNSIEEIKSGEMRTARGEHVENPFVLLAQQGIVDTSRAPEGKHAVWAYCHVPNGSDRDMTTALENQVERFAPGFKDRIMARHTFTAQQMELYNSNYVGGDINGGAFDPAQLFTRPVLKLRPYRTAAKGIYICSASTPPGGGVHGMCGYHAAVCALKDCFR